MVNQDIAKLTGVGSDSKSYVLDSFSLNGEVGGVKWSKTTEPKGSDGFYPSEDLGEKPLNFVLLKQRYRLSKYVEDGDSLRSTEYDKKSEEVMIFPIKEKMTVEQAKEKYDMSVITVVYAWFPDLKVIGKLNIKGLSYGGAEYYPKDKNGWFDFLKKMRDKGLHVHEHITQAEQITVEKKKGKNYVCFSFKPSKKLEGEELENIEKMIVEVSERLKGAAFTEPIREQRQVPHADSVPYPETSEDIADSIPF